MAKRSLWAGVYTTGKSSPKDDSNLYVTCLKCGTKTSDYYNWSYKG